MELVRIREDGEKTITSLGRLGPGDDPLAFTLEAAPGLLTLDPHAAVDITTSSPYALADAVRLGTAPDRDEMIHLAHEDDLASSKARKKSLSATSTTLCPSGCASTASSTSPRKPAANGRSSR